MITDYRKSHLQHGKGISYHASFTKNPYRRMVWRMEQSILDSIVQRFYNKKSITHLDFACGTGRILSFFERYTQQSVGVDLSPSMLQVARENNRHAEIIEEDLTKNDVLGNRKFNLITAFRFFSNAEPELRREVMDLFRYHLADNGFIVFNIHRNIDCTLNRIYKLIGRNVKQGMRITEVTKLINESKLELVEIYHLCVFPVTERRHVLPIFLLYPLEIIMSKCKFLRTFGENLIFVCRTKANNF